MRGLLSSLVTMLLCCMPLIAVAQPHTPVLDALGIDVAADQNRAFSYTDKRNAYFYGKTHEPLFEDYFAGWNVNTRRVFHDYRLWVDGTPLDRRAASVTVYPQHLRRRFGRAIETFEMYDGVAVLGIRLDDVDGTRIGLSLHGDQVAFDEAVGDVAYFTSTEAPKQVLGVTTLRPTAFSTSRIDSSLVLSGSTGSGGFFVALGPDRAAVRALLADARASYRAWFDRRAARMERLVASTNPLQTSYPMLAPAVHWVMLTLDQLVTEQTGHGIYAGLPWFNDYWGRDMFISLPGATLVTGQFDVARNILRSFAAYQNTDPDSPNFGRVPNRLRPDDVIYNTTDGTPRFVNALYAFVQYTGDTTLVHELYPAVRRSIEGPLRHWVDDDGYLTHDDADTWMDAKEDGVTPWSPRGNRAVDIQALWYRQLRAGAYFARMLGAADDAERWSHTAERMLRHFRKDFTDPAHAPFLADRLTAEGEADFSLRPNQLFALDLLDDPAQKAALTRAVWERLVYPWGVASLWQMDGRFHPYHENPACYHKDAAYHNGTVWVWNNGIAMQRMLELGQVAPAYALFENMSRQALENGAVGSLSENYDALPRPGAAWARESGTFLQAWSNAEYLRVWYQYFLGIRPDAPHGRLVLAPRLPRSIDSLGYAVRLLGGTLRGRIDRDQRGATTFVYDFDSIQTTAEVSMPGFETLAIPVQAGEQLRITQTADTLTAMVLGPDGVPRTTVAGTIDAAGRAEQRTVDRVLDGVAFAEPHLRPDLDALQECAAER